MCLWHLDNSGRKTRRGVNALEDNQNTCKPWHFIALLFGLHLTNRAFCELFESEIHKRKVQRYAFTLCTFHFIAASRAFSRPSRLALMRIMHSSFSRRRKESRAVGTVTAPSYQGVLADRFQWLLSPAGGRSVRWLLRGLVLSLSFSGFVSVSENMWM